MPVIGRIDAEEVLQIDSDGSALADSHRLSGRALLQYDSRGEVGDRRWVWSAAEVARVIDWAKNEVEDRGRPHGQEHCDDQTWEKKAADKHSFHVEQNASASRK